jgi:NitT/TauT family transport system permease protein
MAQEPDDQARRGPASWLRQIMRRRPAATPPPGGPAQAAPAGPPHHRTPFFRVRERVSPPVRAALSVLPFALFFVWWLWATASVTPEFRRVSPTILPSPHEVVNSLPSLWYDSALMRNILLSFTRVICGFTLAALIAVPLGIAMGSFGKIGATFGLFAALLSYIPIPAIVPLTMAWWKTGEEQKVGFLALGTFAYLLPLVVRHVNAVDHRFLLAAYAQGASGWQVVRRVLVPIALPDIANAMRLCLGIGWAYIVLAEVIKTGEGLGGVGNLIMVFQRRGHMEEVYLTVAAIMLVGALLDRCCARFTTWVFPYRAQTAQE